MLYPSAVFLSGCVTVHDYKNRIEILGKVARRKVFEYKIAECYVMKYEDFYISLQSFR